MLIKILAGLFLAAFAYGIFRMIKSGWKAYKFNRAVKEDSTIEFEEPDDDMQVSEPPHSSTHSHSRSSRSYGGGGYNRGPSLVHLQNVVNSLINKKDRNRSRTRMQRNSRNINHA